MHILSLPLCGLYSISSQDCYGPKSSLQNRPVDPGSTQGSQRSISFSCGINVEHARTTYYTITLVELSIKNHININITVDLIHGHYITNVRRLGGNRVSPGRSAYWASPWCYSLSRSSEVGEKQLFYFPESWCHLNGRALALPNSWLSRIQNAIQTIRKRTNYVFLGKYRPPKAVP